MVGTGDVRKLTVTVSLVFALGCDGGRAAAPSGSYGMNRSDTGVTPSAAGQGANGGAAGSGALLGSGGAGAAAAGEINTGRPASAGGATASTRTDGIADTGGATTRTSAGGIANTGGVANTGGANAADGKYLVGLVQSSRTQARDLTYDDVKDLVERAIAQAGGVDFVKDGQTVVLKPNLVTAYSDSDRTTPAEPTVNGITTDWRVVKAVAELVRKRNPSGKILVMEGSSLPTRIAFSMLGYTVANFGASVDEFVALEGASCTDVSTALLEQRVGASGKKYWINSRYVNAEVVISLPTMKTHYDAGITGAVKNLGLGTTPVGQFPNGNNSADQCGRGQSAAVIDHSGPEPLGAFIRDYYSLRPADFVVMDGLQGLEHGPLPAWDSSGTYDYVASQKNMRLILAGRNAVAVDTIQALIMKCDPKKVPHLTKLEADGLGTTDPNRITVVGKQVSEVATPFAGGQTAICPGK